jgi:hypothetical protein
MVVSKLEGTMGYHGSVGRLCEEWRARQRTGDVCSENCISDLVAQIFKALRKAR